MGHPAGPTPARTRVTGWAAGRHRDGLEHAVRRLRRSLGLMPGNPMNPVTLLVLGFFALVLVGFPPFMAAVGLDRGGIVLVMAVVVLTAIPCCGFTVALARRYLRDFERLLAGGAWVRWRATPAERARFVAHERGRARRQAGRFAGYALVLALLGAAVMWAFTRTAAGAALGFAVLGAAGLLVVATTFLWGGARERPDAPDLDETYLGDLGIYHLGRYTPLRGTNLFLVRVELHAGDPNVLEFTIGSRTQHGTVRPSEVRVLVPAGREGEAAELVARYRGEFGLAT